jgi:type VI secretion system Hcp family effector
MSVAKLFLKLVGTQAGPIKGESQVFNYVDQIEIDDWSVKFEKESNPETGDTLNVPSVISFGKLLDRATTPMLLAMLIGDSLTATITLEEVAADQFGLNVTLEDARLLNYSMDAKDQEKSTSVEETWTLDYRKIKFQHQSDNRRGTSVYELSRPAWASTKSPNSGKDKVSEIAKLAAEFEPGALDEMWSRVKELIVKNREGKTSSEKSQAKSDAKGSKS